MFRVTRVASVLMYVHANTSDGADRREHSINSIDELDSMIAAITLVNG